MALNNPRKIPELKAATHDEFIAAVEGLTDDELRKLRKAASHWLRGSTAAKLNRDAQDLFNATIQAFLEPNGRTWNKAEVDIVRTLSQAMRSVASNWRAEYKRKVNVQAQLLIGREEDPQEFINNAAVTAATDQDRLEAEELKAAMKEQINEIYKLVEEREKASYIFMLMSEGKDGPSIREELGLTVQEHESLMLWIRRKVRKKFKDGRVR